MSSYKEHVLIVCIKRQRPYSLTRKIAAFRIDSRPRQSRIRAAENAASDFSCLIRIADKNFIAVARVHEDAREVAERKIGASHFPRHAVVMRHVERLLRSNINVIGTAVILRDHIDRNVARNTEDLAPRPSAVT